MCVTVQVNGERTCEGEMLLQQTLEFKNEELIATLKLVQDLRKRERTLTDRWARDRMYSVREFCSVVIVWYMLSGLWDSCVSANYYYIGGNKRVMCTHHQLVITISYTPTGNTRTNWISAVDNNSVGTQLDYHHTLGWDLIQCAIAQCHDKEWVINNLLWIYKVRCMYELRQLFLPSLP